MAAHGTQILSVSTSAHASTSRTLPLSSIGDLVKEFLFENGVRSGIFTFKVTGTTRGNVPRGVRIQRETPEGGLLLKVLPKGGKARFVGVLSSECSSSQSRLRTLLDEGSQEDQATDNEREREISEAEPGTETGICDDPGSVSLVGYTLQEVAREEDGEGRKVVTSSQVVQILRRRELAGLSKRQAERTLNKLVSRGFLKEVNSPRTRKFAVTEGMVNPWNTNERRKV